MKFRPQDWWRVLRTAGYLALRPQDIPDYFRYGPFCKTSPLELGFPWWSFGAVRHLRKELRPTMTAFEYGSGGSTLFLSAYVAQVTAIEDEASWAEKVTTHAGQHGRTNITVHHHPFDFWQTKNFTSSSYLLALDTPYDLIVIDGKEWDDHVRDLCFTHAEKFIKPGGIILLDDSWRYPQVFKNHHARRLRQFRGTGYCRPGVTTTTLFYY